MIPAMLEQFDKDFARMLYEHWKKQADSYWHNYYRTDRKSWLAAYYQAHDKERLYYYLSR